MNYFQEILNRAMRQCHETYSSLFDYIYPFTTENISGYINEFTLENRSLLTVGSSSDQVLNAILYGCENVTLLDINPYTKFYYYLKVACILTLNKEEYLEFLRYYNYPKVFKDNKNCFNIEIFNDPQIFLMHFDSQYNLIFLDIEMDKINGIECGKAIRKIDKSVIIIFVTNTAKYAIQGYEVEALDYIVKPINNEVFFLKMERALKTIEQELEERVEYFKSQNKLIEAQRIQERTNFDMEMMKETGFCQGIENYSRHISGREPGSAPFTLFDYFPKDFLLLIDESHATIPQVRAMYNGDRARKDSLVKYGFRLPSAYDNRPLTFKEFEERINQVIFVSATPAEYEKEHSKDNVVEQIIRPTGLLDPKIEVKPVSNQIDDLIEQIRIRVERNERVLVTTLTKKMAEDLTAYLKSLDIKVNYMHSDIKALERMEIIRNLRLGEFDVLVGINLLREGLDIPEVSLVAILDADKEGFLRSERSLIQTIGRAARNTNGTVIMYADELTDSMEKAITETNRRRAIQEAYNKEHNIVPKTINKSIRDSIKAIQVENIGVEYKFEKEDDIKDTISKLTDEMLEHASRMEFEQAAELRDKIKELEKLL